MKPSDLNLPTKFTHFQDGQFESALSITAALANHRFVLFSGPTGSGKTLMMIAAAILSTVLGGGRVLIYTIKKSLQDQYVEDFASIGLVEMRGQANYRCLALDPEGELSHMRMLGTSPGRYMGCDKGPCREGMSCSLKASGCLKYDAIREANQANLVVTNYAYGIQVARFSPDVLGKFDLLILDEAHEAANWVEKFNTATFDNKSLKDLMDAKLPVIEQPWLGGDKKRGPTKYERNVHHAGWVEWATKLHPEVSLKLKNLKSRSDRDFKLINKMKTLDTNLSIVETKGIDWSIDNKPQEAILTPTWVGPLCETNLFQGIPKVILTSATLSEEVAKYTGIGRKKYKYLEMPSRFSAKRRPVLYAQFPKDKAADDPNRKVCMSYRSSMADEVLQVERIDQLIEARQDRKGLILPVTYDRMELILANSRWVESGVLFGHKRGSTNVKNAVERFRGSSAPSCIVSPVLGDGIDFKDDQCRYLIIPKIPMVPVQSAVMEERCRQDSGYQNYLTSLTLTQYIGRLMRGPLDWGEVIILDGQWEWWINKANFANWFSKACFTSRGLPEAMEVPK